MTRCAAINCNKEGVHTFPKDPNRRKRWEIAIKRENFKAGKHSRLCRSHFKDSDYASGGAYTDPQMKMFLKKTAVPTIFHWSEPAALAVRREMNIFKRARNHQPKAVSNGPVKNDHDYCHEVVKNDHDYCYELTDVQTSEIPPPTNTHNQPKMCSVTTQTFHKLTGVKTIEILPSTSFLNKPKMCSVTTQTVHIPGWFYVEDFKMDAEGMFFYTGLKTYEQFQLVFHTLCPMVYDLRYYHSQVMNLSMENQLFLTLIKLRRSTTLYELSKIFGISKSTISNVFITWINFIYQIWSEIWPDRDIGKLDTPEQFERTDNPVAHRYIFNPSKNRNSQKVSGDPARSASSSDRSTNESCDPLNICEAIVDDKDVPKDIECEVNLPPFYEEMSQLTGFTSSKDCELASKRVHKAYKILKNELHRNYVPLASKIFYICTMLCNFSVILKTE